MEAGHFFSPGKNSDIRLGIGLAQPDHGFLERYAELPHGDPRPERPARKALVSDKKMEFGHGQSTSSAGIIHFSFRASAFHALKAAVLITASMYSRLERLTGKA